MAFGVPSSHSLNCFGEPYFDSEEFCFLNREFAGKEGNYLGEEFKLEN
jgi:hypothetical protein